MAPAGSLVGSVIPVACDARGQLFGAMAGAASHRTRRPAVSQTVGLFVWTDLTNAGPGVPARSTQIARMGIRPPIGI